MSRRDGHEWDRLPSLEEHDCEGKDGQCDEQATWGKTLFACNKTTYFGGNFCDGCKEAEDG